MLIISRFFKNFNQGASGWFLWNNQRAASSCYAETFWWDLARKIIPISENPNPRYLAKIWGIKIARFSKFFGNSKSPEIFLSSPKWKISIPGLGIPKESHLCCGLFFTNRIVDVFIFINNYKCYIDNAVLKKGKNRKLYWIIFKHISVFSWYFKTTLGIPTWFEFIFELLSPSLWTLIPSQLIEFVPKSPRSIKMTTLSKIYFWNVRDLF